jgi:medium-chain acyl-[acyl-carrier-protein] hydrolase
MSTPPLAPWYRRYPTSRPARARLLAFHHAGGSASYFRSWPAALPPDLEVIAIQMPGREERLRVLPPRSLDHAADELARQLAPLLDLPFAIFGHSMGALLAFETTRALRRAHHAAPRHLFVSGRWAPHLPDPLPTISRFPERELLDTITRMGGTPPEVLAHRELLDLFLPTLRADFALCESYHHRSEPPLSLPLTAFGGLSDATTAPATIEHWSAHTHAAFRARFFPGDHFFLDAARPAILADITASLDPAAPASPAAVPA